MRLFTAVCAVALVSGLAIAPSFAQSDYDSRQERVYIGDLDPYDRGDAQILLDRIERASNNVCDNRMPEPPTELEQEAACEFHATEEAVISVGNPVLLALHRGYDPSIAVEAEGSADPYDSDYIVVKKK
jgi:UrcA family protein